jgi:hypothetical protein
MRAELHLDLEETLRQIVREEIERASAAQPSGLFNVKRASAYLDMSEDALRGLVKRRQIEFNKSDTGRITFNREQLEGHARGELR